MEVEDGISPSRHNIDIKFFLLKTVIFHVFESKIPGLHGISTCYFRVPSINSTNSWLARQDIVGRLMDFYLDHLSPLSNNPFHEGSQKSKPPTR